MDLNNQNRSPEELQRLTEYKNQILSHLISLSPKSYQSKLTQISSDLSNIQQSLSKDPEDHKDISEDLTALQQRFQNIQQISSSNSSLLYICEEIEFILQLIKSPLSLPKQPSVFSSPLKELSEVKSLREQIQTLFSMKRQKEIEIHHLLMKEAKGKSEVTESVVKSLPSQSSNSNLAVSSESPYGLLLIAFLLLFLTFLII